MLEHIRTRGSHSHCAAVQQVFTFNAKKFINTHACREAIVHVHFHYIGRENDFFRTAKCPLGRRAAKIIFNWPHQTVEISDD
jgi:diadenosine tetraphosphate (Ap4A) HIT family hydrolase